MLWSEVHAVVSAEARFLTERANECDLAPHVLADYASRFCRGDPSWPEAAWHTQRFYELLLHQHFGHFRWEAGHSAAIIDAFPANELIKTRATDFDDWRPRWIALGGEVFGERCTALRGDSIWARFCVFGQPYAPFEWTGVLDVAVVGRRECVALGIIEK